MPSKKTADHPLRSTNISRAAESPLPPSDQAFLTALQAEFPQFHFKSGSRFAFHPPKTIITGPPQPFFGLQTLHELGHALSGSYDYKTHVERLKIESTAWQHAKQLCLSHPEWDSLYGISYDEDFAEESLDTYRNWLHHKTTCPRCGLTTAETPDGHFHCPSCDLL